MNARCIAKPAALFALFGLAACIAPRVMEPTPSFLPTHFRALGTEPFWLVDVSGQTLTYSTPEHFVSGLEREPIAEAYERRNMSDHVELWAQVEGRPLRLKVTPGPCSDGMSDTVFMWSVERELDGETAHGCAELPLVN